MKTYKARSSATRQARAQYGGDYLSNGSIEVTKDGMFYFETSEDKELKHIYGTAYCPNCGTHLSNGHTTHEYELEAGSPIAKTMTKQFICLGCAEEFGPEVVRLSKVIKSTSSADRPCNLVWEIAIRMNNKAQADHTLAPKRSQVIHACVEAGVNYNTARTQYQAWFKASNKK